VLESIPNLLDNRTNIYILIVTWPKYSKNWHTHSNCFTCHSWVANGASQVLLLYCIAL